MRTEDVFLALDERTAQTNIYRNCIFISLHANWASNKDASGIETFCLQSRLFNPKINMDHTHQRWCKSKLLAQSVQKNILAQVVPLYGTKNRKVKNAVPQVLLGATCPAILVELGFLSNTNEAELLACPLYQQLLAKGICEGILTFIKNLQ